MAGFSVGFPHFLSLPTVSNVTETLYNDSVYKSQRAEKTACSYVLDNMVSCRTVL